MRRRGPTCSEKGWEEQTAKRDGARAWGAVGDPNVTFGGGIWTVADLDGVVVSLPVISRVPAGPEDENKLKTTVLVVPVSLALLGTLGSN